MFESKSTGHRFSNIDGANQRRQAQEAARSASDQPDAALKELQHPRNVRATPYNVDLGMHELRQEHLRNNGVLGPQDKPSLIGKFERYGYLPVVSAGVAAGLGTVMAATLGVEWKALQLIKTITDNFGGIDSGPGIIFAAWTANLISTAFNAGHNYMSVFYIQRDLLARVNVIRSKWSEPFTMEQEMRSIILNMAERIDLKDHANRIIALVRESYPDGVDKLKETDAEANERRKHFEAELRKINRSLPERNYRYYDSYFKTAETNLSVLFESFGQALWAAAHFRANYDSLGFGQKQQIGQNVSIQLAEILGGKEGRALAQYIFRYQHRKRDFAQVMQKGAIVAGPVGWAAYKLLF